MNSRKLCEAALLDAIYEAAFWVNDSRPLERIADVLGADAAFLGTLDLRSLGNSVRSLGSSTFLLARLDPAIYLKAAVGPPNSPWEPCVMTDPCGTVINSEDLIPHRDLLRADFYREVLEPADIGHGLGCQLSRSPEHTTGLFLFRSGRHGPFERSDEKALSRVVPFLRNAVLLSERVRPRVAERAAAHEILETLSAGVVLLDRRGRVVYMNRSAAGAVAAADGLTVKDRELSAASPVEASRLKRFLAQLVDPEAEMPAQPALAISRPSQLRPYSLLGVRLPASGSAHLPFRCAAFLFLNDPERPQGAHPEALIQLYGLTSAEADVAIAIAEAGGVQQAAKALGVRPNTVRAHLQHIFEKTGTRRQAELVRLILAGCGQLRTIDPR